MLTLGAYLMKCGGIFRFLILHLGYGVFVFSPNFDSPPFRIF